MGPRDLTSLTPSASLPGEGEAHMSERQLVYEADELMLDHTFDEPQMVNGRLLHGGFIDGRYQSPRALVRSQAIQAWTESLQSRGGAPLAAGASLLLGARLPNSRQQMVLVRNGLDQTFWNSLTIIGKIEAKGRLLAEMEFPDLQDSIADDISDMAIGHLRKGLLLAHGLDEGGQPREGIGGHDEMWFVARDLAFGPDAHPDVEPPENIGRLVSEDNIHLGVSPQAEGLVSFLANLLVIEFRAELGFAETQEVLRDPELFAARRPEAELAAEIVERIRTDELIHVESLCLYLGELRGVSFHREDGGLVTGSDLIDSFWSDLTHWAAVEQPALMAVQQRALLEQRISRHPEAERVLSEFNAAA